MSPSLLSRCGVRSPRADAGKAPGERGRRAEPSDRAVLERAGSCQTADGGRVDVAGARVVGLCLALCKAMQRLITLMRSPWRNISDGRHALDAP
jgi:hypothetical protein